MKEWVIIVLISLGLLLVLFGIIAVSRYLEKSKLKSERKVVLQKEEEQRIRRQKVLEDIEAKAKAIAERREQIKQQFKWLEGMNEKIKEKWD